MMQKNSDLFPRWKERICWLEGLHCLLISIGRSFYRFCHTHSGSIFQGPTKSSKGRVIAAQSVNIISVQRIKVSHTWKLIPAALPVLIRGYRNILQHKLTCDSVLGRLLLNVRKILGSSIGLGLERSVLVPINYPCWRHLWLTPSTLTASAIVWPSYYMWVVLWLRFHSHCFVEQTQTKSLLTVFKTQENLPKRSDTWTGHLGVPFISWSTEPTTRF